MSDPVEHISVCVCTYRRPQLLNRLLLALGSQETNGRFTYSIVVGDNDELRSADAIVSEFADKSGISVTYCVEPKQSITLARNKTIENANGDFVAFIDDDEYPRERWLFTLLDCCKKYDADGVLGPVKPQFDETPPTWVVKSKVYERRTYSTGTAVSSKDGRTGNVLLRKRVFTPGEPPFRPEFHRGGDTDFFARMINRGHVFVWCNEAAVYEVVPPSRWKRTFMLKRAFIRGSNNLKLPDFGPRSIAKSIIAAPIYIIALPFALFLGQHRFMSLLVRLCDHLGKLTACIGINPVKSPYATD